jgi:hypothetical protein
MRPDVLADHLRHVARETPAIVAAEATPLARTVARTAPRRSGRLARSFRARGLEVISTAPHALQVDRGGVIRARRHGYLLVPVRPTYAPTTPGLVTVRGRRGPIVVRSGTWDLWALRLRQVRTRRTDYLAEALRRHLDDSPERVAEGLVRETL